VLGGFGLQLARGREVGKQRQVHQDGLPTRAFVDELADGFEEGQALDVADGAADLAEHEVDLGVADAEEVLDLVGDVGDHLDGLAEVVATAFLFQHVGIDPAGGDAVGGPRMDAGEAFVVAEVEVGLGPVVGDENLTMLERRHRAGVDVQVGVKLAQADRVAAGLQKRAQSGRGKALAEGGNHAAGDENVTRQGGTPVFTCAIRAGWNRGTTGVEV